MWLCQALVKFWLTVNLLRMYLVKLTCTFDARRLTLRFLPTGFLAKAKADISADPKKVQPSRPTLLRSLFTLGLLCKHFDFDSDVKPHNQVLCNTGFYWVYSSYESVITGSEGGRARQHAWELVDFLSITFCAIKWKEKNHELSNECYLAQLRSCSGGADSKRFCSSNLENLRFYFYFLFFYFLELELGSQSLTVDVIIR